MIYSKNEAANMFHDAEWLMSHSFGGSIPQKKIDANYHVISKSHHIWESIDFFLRNFILKYAEQSNFVDQAKPSPTAQF